MKLFAGALEQQRADANPAVELHYGNAGAGGYGLKRCSVGASSPAPPRVSVVIPALNEARNLPHVFARLPPGLHEVIVVDGHSVDDTVATARRLRPDVRIVRQNRYGKGNAVACGLAAATGDIIALVDADGSVDPAEIPRFVKALLGGADFAQGTRFADGGGSSDVTRLRRLGNWLLSVLFSVVVGSRYTDLCYGYSVFWRRILPVLRLDADTDVPVGGGTRLWGDGFEVDVLMNIRAVRAGLMVTEVPSYEHSRIHGVSNLNAFSDGFRVMRAIAAERLYHPESKAIAHRRNGARRPSLMATISERLPRQVTGIALKMAGRQRAHLRDAWDSDLLDENGVPLSLSNRLRHVAGYVPAAIRYRIDDLAAVLGRALDAVLISQRRTRTIAGALFGIPVEMIFSREGLYGLVTNADSLAALFAALCASVSWLRKWRGVKPPEKKKNVSR
jgi:hypothetical protein